MLRKYLEGILCVCLCVQDYIFKVCYQGVNVCLHAFHTFQLMYLNSCGKKLNYQVLEETNIECVQILVKY